MLNNMPITDNLLNPCFCITLRAGTLIVGVLDLIFAIVYMVRYQVLFIMKDNLNDFFPSKYPSVTRKDYEKMYIIMVPWGNFAAQLASGIGLLMANLYFRYHFYVVSGICYGYISIRACIMLVYIAEVVALIDSGESHFKHRAVELIIGLIFYFYFCLVVAAFVCETRIDLNKYRAIRPINIEPDEYEAYLKHDKDSIFIDSTFYHILTPDYFLTTAKRNERVMDLGRMHVDESMLQYLIENRQVAVEEGRESKDSLAELSDDDTEDSNEAPTIRSIPKRVTLKLEEDTIKEV